MVYLTQLGRYLLALGFDMRGGWGLFDAPAPWGPWTTVFSTGDWGLGNTHSYRLPTKWIDEARSRMAVVFSGQPRDGQDFDAFAVRTFRLEPFGYPAVP